MITDKNSKGYKIACEIAEIWKREGKEAAIKAWERTYAGDKSLVFWVQHAIGDTVLSLLKQQGIKP